MKKLIALFSLVAFVGFLATSNIKAQDNKTKASTTQEVKKTDEKTHECAGKKDPNHKCSEACMAAKKDGKGGCCKAKKEACKDKKTDEKTSTETKKQ